MINEAQRSAVYPAGRDFNFWWLQKACGTKKWFWFSRFCSSKGGRKERLTKGNRPWVNPYGFCGLCGSPPCSSDPIRKKQNKECTRRRMSDYWVVLGERKCGEDARTPPAGSKWRPTCDCWIDVVPWVEIAKRIFPLASGLHHKSSYLEISHQLDILFLDTYSMAVISSAGFIWLLHTHNTTHLLSLSLRVSTPLQAADREVVWSAQWSQTKESE